MHQWFLFRCPRNDKIICIATAKSLFYIFFVSGSTLKKSASWIIDEMVAAIPEGLALAAYVIVLVEVCNLCWSYLPERFRELYQKIELIMRSEREDYFL